MRTVEREGERDQRYMVLTPHPPVTEALDAQPLEIVVLEIPEHLAIDVVVLHEALVLPRLHSKLLTAAPQEVHNLVHAPIRLQECSLSSAPRDIQEHSMWALQGTMDGLTMGLETAGRLPANDIICIDVSMAVREGWAERARDDTPTRPPAPEAAPPAPAVKIRSVRRSSRLHHGHFTKTSETTLERSTVSVHNEIIRPFR